MKLSAPQEAFLRSLPTKAVARYKPADALVRKGLAYVIPMSDLGLQNPTFGLTDAGRKWLREHVKVEGRAK